MGPRSPLKFVDIDENGMLSINEDTMTIIQTFTHEIAIIGVIGGPGSGKSFSLNELMKNDGFKLASNVDQCTRGLWLWGDPLPQPGGPHILLLDSEGLDPYNKKGLKREKLILLLLLLSSSVIHSQLTGQQIRPRTLNDLSIMTRLSSSITVGEQQESSQQAAPSFEDVLVLPKLFWLIRDLFRIKPKKTPDEHLEEELQHLEDCSFNDTRESIKNYFRFRRCFILPRPCDSASIALSLPQSSKDLNIDYIKDRDVYVKSVLNATKGKRLDGIALTGPMLVEVTRLAVDTFNKGGKVALRKIWKLAQEKLSTRANVVGSQHICSASVVSLSARVGSGNPLPIQQNEFRPTDFAVHIQHRPVDFGNPPTQPLAASRTQFHPTNSAVHIQPGAGGSSSSGNPPTQPDTAALSVLNTAKEKYKTSFDTKLGIVYRRCATSWNLYKAYVPEANQEDDETKALLKKFEELFRRAHTEASQDATEVIELAKLGNLELEMKQWLNRHMDTQFQLFNKLKRRNAFQDANNALRSYAPLE